MDYRIEKELWSPNPGVNIIQTRFKNWRDPLFQFGNFILININTNYLKPYIC